MNKDEEGPVIIKHKEIKIPRNKPFTWIEISINKWVFLSMIILFCSIVFFLTY